MYKYLLFFLFVISCSSPVKNDYKTNNKIGVPFINIIHTALGVLVSTK